MSEPASISGAHPCEGPDHPTLAEARDACRAIVTALLAGDRDTPIDIIQGFGCFTILMLVMADQCTWVHTRWSQALCLDRNESWQQLMIDLEEGLAEREP